MDFSAQLEKLQQRINETVASLRTASVESRDQLKQRIDQAQVDANLALKDAKQQAEEASDQAQSKWAQMKADASAKLDDVKAKIDARADQHDAKAAAKDADKAERDASDAIDYAVWLPTVRGSPCSTRWTRVPTQTNGPRSPARRDLAQARAETSRGKRPRPLATVSSKDRSLHIAVCGWRGRRGADHRPYGAT
jgi:membrane protein involved in colicin uptake